MSNTNFGRGRGLINARQDSGSPSEHPPTVQNLTEQIMPGVGRGRGLINARQDPWAPSEDPPNRQNVTGWVIPGLGRGRGLIHARQDPGPTFENSPIRQNLTGEIMPGFGRGQPSFSQNWDLHQMRVAIQDTVEPSEENANHGVIETMNQQELPSTSRLPSTSKGHGESSKTRVNKKSFPTLKPENDFKNEAAENVEENYEELIPCRYQNEGCQVEVGFTAVEYLSEHIERHCPFRYTINCFIPGCDSQTNPLFAGFFQGHLIEVHNTPLTYFALHVHQPFAVHLDPVWNMMENTMSQLLLMDPSKHGLMFPLMMTTTADFVYIWIYQLTDRDAPQEKFLGDMRILRHFSSRRFAYNVDNLSKEDIIHDVSVPIEEIIKSGRVIQIPLNYFEATCISKVNEIGANGKKIGERQLIRFNLTITGVTMPAAYESALPADLEREAILLAEEVSRNEALKEQNEKEQLDKTEATRKQSKKYAAKLKRRRRSI